MTIDEFLELCEGVTPHPGGFKVVCPAHEDNTPSLGVSEGIDGTILLNCYGGCDNASVVAAMDLSFADLFPGNRKRETYGEPEAIYQYQDEVGRILYEAVRFPGKKFRQRHLDPETGEYVYSLEGIRRVLYLLPDIMVRVVQDNEPIYITEGEKDVLAIRATGAMATCNPMGAGKWRDDYSVVLQNRVCIIVCDKDEPGRHHAEQVKVSLQSHGCIVSVVEAREGKDAADHLGAGYTLEEFVPVPQRSRRGIVTAREMATNGTVHLASEQGTVPEYIIPDFALGKHALALRQGRPYLLGGYTGDGKTTTALQIARTLCSSPVPPRVGFFSMEMSSDDLRNRIIEHWGLSLYTIEHPWTMDVQERTTYQYAIEQLREWPLEIIFDTQLSAESVCQVTRDRDYDVIFLDHIHRFSWGGERRNLESEISMLTNLALDFNIPVFVLAQLRAVRSGQGKFEKFPRPTLAEFKETSVLGEEAAMALAIWRHRLQDTAYDPSGISELIVLKNRYGPTTSTFLKLDPRRMIFTPGGVPNATEPFATPEIGVDTPLY